MSGKLPAFYGDPGLYDLIHADGTGRIQIVRPADDPLTYAYLKALGEKQKIVSLKLADGEVVRGWIEYYDKNMVRVTREDGPNLFIFKHEIVYIAEDGKKK